jgi:predicted transcriptional regulator
MAINMRIDADLVRRMDAAAKRMSITRTAFVSMTIAKAVENEER